jgi:hypothetical protein
LLLAIAIQESDLKHRLQRPSGRAKSWWQIERFTAIDSCTRCKPVAKLCAEIGMEYEHSDLAACAIAAGILRITPGKLPVVGMAAEEVERAWNYYFKAWRPGKPRPERWPSAYETAMQTVVRPEWKLERNPDIGLVPTPISADNLANPADIGWIPNT